jgi:hypothetical protein
MLQHIRNSYRFEIIGSLFWSLSLIHMRVLNFLFNVSNFLPENLFVSGTFSTINSCECSKVFDSVEVKWSDVMILGELCVFSLIYIFVAVCRFCAVLFLVIICFCLLFYNYSTYFDVCTVHLVQFIIQTTNAQHIHINNFVYVVSTPTCFDASASSSDSLILQLC